MTSQPPGHRHLSVEELSDRLDRADGGAGAGPGAVGAPGATVVAGADGHLAACDRCRAQLAALEGARAALRAPVPSADPSVRAATIATVVAAAVAAPGDGPDGAGAEGAPALARPWPPEPASTGRRRWVGGIGAAAAVAALTAGLTLAALHGSPTGSSSASRAAQGTGTASGRTPAAHGAPGTSSDKLSAAAPDGPLRSAKDATSPGRPVPDLGPLASAGALRAALAPAPAPQSVAQPAAPSASDSTPGYSVETPSGQGSATRSPYSDPERVFGPIAPADASAFPRCLSAAYGAVHKSRAVGALEELATARYRGTAALVFVFSGSGAAPGEAVAVARDGCRLLVTAAL